MLLLLTLLACAPGGDAEVPWGPPDAAGPFDVGLLTHTFTDDRGKELTVDIWYPAVWDGEEELAGYEPMTLTKAAYREIPAETAGAPWPMVGFSHGFGGIRFQSAYLTERLASHGFVVVAPDHPGNTFLDLDDEASPQVMLERPDDVRASVDELIRLAESGDALLGGMVEDGAWAAVGHSFGAITTMTLGGGELNYDSLKAFCDGGGDGRACGYLEGLDSSAVEGHGTVDERVVTAVPMSPGLWYAFGDGGEGLAQVERPFVLAGDLDEVLEYDTEALPVYEAMSAPKALATFHGAAHYGFTDICLLIPAFADECGGAEDGFLEVEISQQVSATLVTAHLGVTLAGDDRYAEWLTGDYAADIDALTLEGR
jgi:predicted dienelactone hydrolase